MQQQVLDSREEKYKAELELMRLQLTEVRVAKEDESWAREKEWEVKTAALEAEYFDSKQQVESLKNEAQDIADFIALQMEVEQGVEGLEMEEMKEKVGF